MKVPYLQQNARAGRRRAEAADRVCNITFLPGLVRSMNKYSSFCICFVIRLHPATCIPLRALR